MDHRVVLVISAMFLVLTSAAHSEWVAQHAGLPFGTDTRQLYFAAVDASVCWAVPVNDASAPGTYTRTTDGGTHWIASAVPGAGNVLASSMTAFDANRAWIIFNDLPKGGGIYATTDGGTSWTRQTSAFTSGGAAPRFVKFFDAQNGLAVGNPTGGYWEIYVSTNGGGNWTRIPSSSIPAPLSGEVAYLGGAPASYGNTFWFPTSQQSLYKTTDRGITWTVARNAFPGAVGFAAAFKDSMNGLLVSAESQQVRSSVDGGATFSNAGTIAGFTPGYLAPIPGTDDTYMLTNFDLFGWSPGSAYTRDNGATWIPIDAKNHGRSAFISPSVGWSGGGNDSLYKWVGMTLVDYWHRQTVILPLGLSTTQMQFAAVDSNIVWCANVNAAGTQRPYARTTNGGKNWYVSLVTGLGPTPVSSSITAVDALIAWIAFSSASVGGGVFRTTNGGVDWIRQTTAFGSGGEPRFVKFFDAQNGLAVGNPNGGYWEIYTTTNGGDNWSRVPSDSIPAPLSGESAYTGGASCSFGDRRFWFPTNGQSVYRTTNRGRSWTVSRNAYPGAVGSAVAFRDSLNGLLSGDGPNPGFRRTTDGGESWTQVGAPNGITPSFVTAVPGSKGSYLASSWDMYGWQPGSAFTRNDGMTWEPVDYRNHGRAVFLSASFGWSAGDGNTLYGWDRAGYGSFVLPVQQSPAVTPAGFSLEQNYPNPFNPATVIRYQISAVADVDLTVFDLLGRTVGTLVNERKAPGSYEVKFEGAGLASGTYVCRLTAGGAVQTRKMILLR
ncbi:MAG: hypothetical protein H6Q31_2063 [Bacteroidetes bacterium]|nr:hypothetical protein [Bacteroidota bacterium]